MSTDMTLQIKSTNSEQTERLGEQLGRMLRGGEVIELSSDLGGGKTTLVRGIARGAGSSDVVSSPTFTISKEYSTPLVHLYHYDFYRLEQAGLIAHELADAFTDPTGVILIEWSEVVVNVLPEKRLHIRINRTADDSRHITVTYPAELAYVCQLVREPGSEQ